MGQHAATKMGTAFLLAVTASAGLLAADSPETQTFTGRGVFHVGGVVLSQLRGVGSRPDNATNRIAMDDAFSQVTVDPVQHRITWTNTRPYKTATVVGDVALLADGTSAKGEHFSVGVHCVLSKEGNVFTADAHPHPSSRDAMVQVSVEPFEVVVDNGVQKTVVLTADQSRHHVTDRKWLTQVASHLVQVENLLAGVKQDPTLPGYKLVDFAVGVGPPLLNNNVIRVEVVALDGNAALATSRSVQQMATSGTFELRLTSTSIFLPKDSFDREFFLMGLEHIPFLQRLSREGLAKGETLVVRLDQGRGEIRLGSDHAEVPHAADVLRGWMEFSFVGGLVARAIINPPQGR